MGKIYQRIQNSITQPSLKKMFQGKPSPKAFQNSSVCWYNILKRKNHPQKSIKGISALSFRNFQKKKTCVCRGSMTLEAAMVLPLFMFFFLNLLWIIEIYNLQGTLQMALRECGREMSVYAYAYDRIVQEEEDEGLEAFIENITFSYLYVKNRVETLAGREYLEKAPVRGGSAGLVYADSSILQKGDIIDLVVSYQAIPFIEVIGFEPGWFYVRYYGRAWTGYDVTKEGSSTEERYVYVAEHASVYHLDRECSHIRLSISEKPLQQVYTLRNESGECYKACERCISGTESMVYITDFGNCYHSLQGCSALSRTIRKIPLSQAQALYKACARCGR